jgi:hypothetical protein
MSRVEAQGGRNKESVMYFLPTILAIGIVAWTGESISMAAPNAATYKLNVTPHTNLKKGQIVKVTGSGFAKNSPGSILECSDAPGQPTINFLGNKKDAIPVSCSNPLGKIVTTTNSGKIGSTSFTIETGVTGPPEKVVDSAGHNASTDAKEYPCPPTSAQLRAGVQCEIRFGDAVYNEASQNINFAVK